MNRRQEYQRVTEGLGAVAHRTIWSTNSGWQAAKGT